MVHTITLSDEQYQRLETAAQASGQRPDEVLVGLLEHLPEPEQPLSQEERQRRWNKLWQSVHHVSELTNEDIDAAIAEEAASDHADESV